MWRFSPIQRPSLAFPFDIDKLCAVKEIGLQHIWAKQAFYPQNLQTESGKPIEIIYRGDWNHQNGPDFLHAAISIAGITLHGAIEIHTKSSDWFAHGHHTDPRYNQTILHVVFDNNKPCHLENGQSLECLSLRNRINIGSIQENEAPTPLPCSPLLSLCTETIKIEQLEIALTKRIHEKTSRVLSLLQTHNGDWWYTGLEMILCAWLGKGNLSAAQLLAQHLHKSFIMRNRNPTTLMAYLFGQAGWLCDNNLLTDDYAIDLRDRYNYLRIKHQFEPCFPLWNNRQLRPSALPQIRLAQLSAWLSACNGDLQSFFSPAVESLEDWITHFTAEADNYWETHYCLGKTSAPHHYQNGKEHAIQVITNGLIPFLFAFGIETHKPKHSALAMELLSQLPPENNRIIREMGDLRIQNSSAKWSQAIIGQHHAYCNIKNCKHCGIGRHLLNLPFMGGSP